MATRWELYLLVGVCKLVPLNSASCLKPREYWAGLQALTHVTGMGSEGQGVPEVFLVFTL